MKPASGFEAACWDLETVRSNLLGLLPLTASFRLSLCSHRLRASVEDHFTASAVGGGTPPPALGDEVVWQRLRRRRSSGGGREDGDGGDRCDGVDFESWSGEDLSGWSYRGDVRHCDGPAGEPDALELCRVGQAVRLPQPVELGLEWTVCAWTLFRGGRPHRPGFEQPDGWREGEHALVSSGYDDQHVFYSEDRGNWLGCYCGDPQEWGYDEGLDVDGFFSSQYSFRGVPDGWHHVAAVGSRWRLGMGWVAEKANGNGSTRYYVDAEHVGSVPFNLQAAVEYVGNVSDDGELTQPWGIMADFRIFRRTLSQREILLLMAK